ncbi:cwfJ family protein [Cavenderia fasciculata]|uniref:CwfJ family protein n=1 Tax=Cavenderia fasciculata TaxID=261658 RepID=F4Q4R5_CACFS|nr:cwfJ family protein [Cavenderia fasciculata]EGG17861.1 cwfJ family protein [Cavenderia fasciculata]|eukprot:XP_004356345.1 cwfJ family protein [Cavenderia fasciculata]
MSVKVLVCGDIGGNFKTIFDRVDKVNQSKAGPFDILLCVGSFFERFQQQTQGHGHHHHHQQQQHQQQEEIDIKDFLKDRKLSLPTYFIINSMNEIKYLEKYGVSVEDGGQICDNLFYLGRRGILEYKGATIAYLSGHATFPVKDSYDENQPLAITKQDISTLIQDKSKFKSIDILLSNQWPRGILNGVTDPIVNSMKNPYQKGYDSIKEIVVGLAPAYHFSKDLHYFQRLPYKNTNSGESSSSLTRFLSLSSVYNDKNEKYLFAMNYQPSKETNVQDATEFPFTTTTTIKRQKTDGDESRQRYGDNNNNSGESYQKGKNKRSHNHLNETKECWFCLSSKNLESHLIVNIGSECYLAMPKGGIVNDHTLIIYIEHKPSFVSLSDDERKDAYKYLDALRKYYKQNGDTVPIVFERNVKVQVNDKDFTHGHLQVVPVPSKLSQQDIIDGFQKLATEKGFTFEHAKNQQEFLTAVQNDQDYFMVILPDNSIIYLVLDQKLLAAKKLAQEEKEKEIKEGEGEEEEGDKDTKTKQQQDKVMPIFEMQFGRHAIVDLLEIPERLNWKKCILDQEQETKQTEQFREAFQPFYDEGGDNDNDNGTTATNE